MALQCWPHWRLLVGKERGPSQPSASFFLFRRSFFTSETGLRVGGASWIQSCPIGPPLMPTYSIPPFLVGQASMLMSISTFTPNQSLCLRPTEPSPAQAGRRGACPPPRDTATTTNTPPFWHLLGGAGGSERKQSQHSGHCYSEHLLAAEARVSPRSPVSITGFPPGPHWAHTIPCSSGPGVGASGPQ